MKLICPSCGAMHSAEGWSNDPVARQCLRLVCEMPNSLGNRCFAYLSLFRSPGRSLQWKKVLRLLSELKTLASGSFVQWEKRVARPNSTGAWGMAMERIIENPPKRLPLKSHGYLRAIAYEIADEMDRAMEVKKNKEERKGNPHNRHSRPICHSREGGNPVAPERVSLEVMKSIRKENMNLTQRRKGAK